MLKIHKPGPKVIKLLSRSAQLSMKFQLLINVEIVKINGKFRFNTQQLVTNLYCSSMLKCLQLLNCWHFNIYVQDKF